MITDIHYVLVHPSIGNAGHELKLCIDELQCIEQSVVPVIVVATVKVCI